MASNKHFWDTIQGMLTIFSLSLPSPEPGHAAKVRSLTWVKGRGWAGSPALGVVGGGNSPVPYLSICIFQLTWALRPTHLIGPQVGPRSERCNFFFGGGG